MKIVIDIPKKLYDRYKEKDHIKPCDIDEWEKALDRCIALPSQRLPYGLSDTIKNGTILPKKSN